MANGFSPEELSDLESADLLVEDLPVEEVVRRKVQAQAKEFDVLMDELAGLESKIKSLWKEIYTNALTDRVLAHVNLLEAMKACHGKADHHGIYGPVIAKYLERMEKATNQIIKLAELVEDYKRHAGSMGGETMTEDEIYDKISSGKVNKQSH